MTKAVVAQTSKKGLKITQYISGILGVNNASLYAISNPPIWATRSPKGFGIHPCRVQKRGTFVLRATLGHTVLEFISEPTSNLWMLREWGKRGFSPHFVKFLFKAAAEGPNWEIPCVGGKQFYFRWSRRRGKLHFIPFRFRIFWARSCRHFGISELQNDLSF